MRKDHCKPVTEARSSPENCEQPGDLKKKVFNNNQSNTKVSVRDGSILKILTDNKSFPTGEHTGISRNIVENSSFLI